MKYKRLTHRLDNGRIVVDWIQNKAGRIHAIDRLADLEDKIEDGTLSEWKICKNITEQHPVDEFICSECGLILEEYCEKRIDEDGDETYHEYEIKYCPNCGAKVVEE